MKYLKPKYAILIVFLAAFFVDFSLEKWKENESVIAHDIHSYYYYLPAQFIYDDIKLEKSDYSYAENKYFFWNQPDKNGDKVAKMTCGLSLLYTPFFFVAHFVATQTNYPADGFSEPYTIFLLLSALFYLVLGLDFLAKTLKLLEFKQEVIFFTILLIGLGTNLLAYSSQSAPMPHVYDFCLFAGFVYNTIKWYNSHALKRMIYLGLLFGLITLIRPSNGLIVLVFMFYGINSLKELKMRVALYRKQILQLLLIIPLVLIVWSPQFLYWKVISGKFLYYSYREEGFYFLSPNIYKGLFSFRKGWFIYTPIMLFSIAGFFFLKEKAKELKTGLIVFSVLNIYIIFSWWCWWYGGTFGQRTVIESYALLAIPFAAFLTWVLNKKMMFKILFGTLCLFFIWLNIFQTYQFENNSLHHDSMSQELYFKQFGKYEKIENFDSYLKYINYKSNKYRNKELKEEKVQKQKVLKGKKVNIKAANGLFLCTEWNREVFADKEKSSLWEEFYIVQLEGGKVALVSYDDFYVSTDVGLYGGVTSNKEHLHDREILEKVDLDDNKVAFKASNGKYWSLQEDLKIMATADSIGVNETFQIIEK